MSMRINVLVPTDEFTTSQIKRLKSLGQVKFINRRREMTLVQLEKFSSEVLKKPERKSLKLPKVCLI